MQGRAALVRLVVQATATGCPADPGCRAVQAVRAAARAALAPWTGQGRWVEPRGRVLPGWPRALARRSAPGCRVRAAVQVARVRRVGRTRWAGPVPVGVQATAPGCQVALGCQVAAGCRVVSGCRVESGRRMVRVAPAAGARQAGPVCRDVLGCPGFPAEGCPDGTPPGRPERPGSVGLPGPASRRSSASSGSSGRISGRRSPRSSAAEGPVRPIGPVVPEGREVPVVPVPVVPGGQVVLEDREGREGRRRRRALSITCGPGGRGGGGTSRPGRSWPGSAGSGSRGSSR